MLTVAEAAGRSGRNPETIRRWIRSGRLRARKVGTQHIIEEADLTVVGDPTLALPEGWDRLDHGTRRPDCARLVADSRRGLDVVALHAEYLALARLLGCRVVTTDGRLRRGAYRLGLVVGPTEL